MNTGSFFGKKDTLPGHFLILVFPVPFFYNLLFYKDKNVDRTTEHKGYGTQI